MHKVGLAILAAAIMLLGYGIDCGGRSGREGYPSTLITTGSSATTTNSARIIYLADYDPTYGGDVLSVLTTGGDSTLLAANVADYAVAPDNATLIYLNIIGDLKSVPISGDAPKTLDVNIESASWEFSADGSIVIYEANYNESDGSYDLKAVPITGGASSTLATNVIDWGVSADRANIVYLAGVDPVNGIGELRLVPIAGGTFQLIDVNIPYYTYWEMTDDNTRLVYDTDVDTRVVPITSGPVVGIPAVLITDTADWELVSDGTGIIYLDSGPLSDTGNLDIMPLAGGVTATLDTGVYDWEISPDKTRVVYTTIDGQIETLKVVSITGGAPLVLDIGVFGLTEIISDNSKVIYQTDFDYYSLTGELRVVALSGGVTTTLASGVLVMMWEATSDNTRLVCLADYDPIAQSGNLKSIPLDGGSAITIATGASYWFEITPDNAKVVYLTAAEGELRIIPINGGTPSVMASPVSYFEITGKQ